MLKSGSRPAPRRTRGRSPLSSWDWSGRRWRARQRRKRSRSRRARLRPRDLRVLLTIVRARSHDRRSAAQHLGVEATALGRVQREFATLWPEQQKWDRLGRYRRRRQRPAVAHCLVDRLELADLGRRLRRRQTRTETVVAMLPSPSDDADNRALGQPEPSANLHRALTGCPALGQSIEQAVEILLLTRLRVGRAHDDYSALTVAVVPFGRPGLRFPGARPKFGPETLQRST
jgi:hypothetical protein